MGHDVTGTRGAPWPKDVAARHGGRLPTQPALAPTGPLAYERGMFGGPPILLCFARTMLRLRLLGLVAGAFAVGARLLLLRLIRP